ncbi:Thiol:disulfide interchange protein DsbD [Pseudoalteromonas carrageenovora]|uniref:Thiol:disulfide interchange protein DsbD n=1 Tax=Pseudoalteromonas carrageenovora IAM 12662 TaxID=1314868 RepID=A0A2K4XD26_PSEVC|nr:protein-disulfide reductase DsbD [Pseudoalteromonas carrageenovora]MBE0381089.1 thiol:disulfide interchange protein DsbD [Pseudoalteromonas carrageenovora IAM 12662]QBJ73100.1 Thiol:disulfide interchange protein DsbD [Pseudoalteromonas carrageenovora]GEB70067.1 thiol:disulfide interchange protein DsbD [Pseudoalteromonas carrageenovora]SOU42219.1 Thiol:disulfide interchange protein: activator of DsbC [Pseudoalteromonas carrageenovora IAM 12662]
MRFFFLLLVTLLTLPVKAENNNLLGDLLGPPQQTFLPVEQAFVFDFDQQGSTLFVGWDIAPDYYLYKKKIEIIAKGANIQVGDSGSGEIIEDEFFGKTEVFFNAVSVVSKLSDITEGAIVKVRYQGCAKAGLCYPPEVISIPLSVINTEEPKNINQTNSNDVATAQSTFAALNEKPTELVKVNSNEPEKELSFTDQLASQSLITNLLIFFVVGVGLAFTPCVFPMFPILSSLIAGQQNLSTKKAFALSFVYIQGMAVTYAALGLVVAALGGQVQGYLQHPFVLISFSLLFVLLAMSMFGWYEIKLPSSMMSKLTQVSNNQKGGNYVGVFLMGVLSGLIASPCTTAPLSAALLFVAQSGDYLVGGLTLYVLSLGMGLPLLLLGTSGGKLLPKAGGWMEQVKTLFGFIMLVVPLILLERIVDADIILLMAGLLALATALYLHYWQSAQAQSKLKTVLWFSAILLALTGFTLTKNYIWPQQNQTTHFNTQTNEFKKVADLAELKEAVAQASDEGRMVMVDLYADWCVACKEFEHYTFPDAKVQSEFNHFQLIQVDLTSSDNSTIELMEEYTVFGLPSILFFNTQGEELSTQRVTGFLNADVFATHLAAVRASAQ